MHADIRFDRRQLLLTAAASGAAAVASGNAASGQQPAPISVNSRNDTSRPWQIGCLGTGGRWNAVGRAAMEFGKILAVCDVDEKHRLQASKIVAKKQDSTPDVYEDYTSVLQRDDVDVITIATPDHWHTKLVIEAMQAGKDVYCEKPLTLTIDEGNHIIETIERTGRVLQVGTQQRTEFDKRFLTAVALCRAGRLGKIQRVTCRIGGAPRSESIPEVEPPAELNWDRWLGPAPFVPYRSLSREKGRPATRCHYEFRWWYEYSGGKMTDWGAHHVDIALWALGKEDTGPTVVTPINVVHPVALDDQGMPTDPTRYNTATEFAVQCQFSDEIQLRIESQGPNGIEFIGEEGTVFVSRQEIRGDAYDQLRQNPLPAELLQRLCKGDIPQGPHPHMRDFFAAVESRRQPISDVYSHHRAMTVCHLANIAIRLGRSIQWDPQRQQIVDDPLAQSMQWRQPREPYGYPL